MSDYVQNPDYSMQLAAPEDDPASYDWARLQEDVDQAIPGPFADITLASLQEDTGVETADWSALNYALENGPWRDIFIGPDDYQGAEAQPGDQGNARDTTSHDDVMSSDGTPAMTAPTATTTASTLEQLHVCDHPNCGSKIFKWKGDLVRHRKQHDNKRPFVCTAQECNYSFTRNDKLRDHIRAGHDDDTLFFCPRTGCQALMTRDMMSVHSFSTSAMGHHRRCPLPKCKFQVRFGLYNVSSVLDNLSKHLLDGHDSKGKKRFASLLANRGYHYEFAEVLCPVCPDISVFKTHEDFKNHLVDSHFGSFRQPNADEQRRPVDRTTAFWIEDSNVPGGWRVYDAFPRELHEHRRTILSVWPGFKYYRVWADIESCSGF